MSTSVGLAFVKQFEGDVHTAYQRKGSKIRGMVRTKNGVVGGTTTFQKVGKGSASTKARHGLVPVMNVDHEPVECILQDFYAGDYVDKLDELKTNIQERKVTAEAGAFALGRKTDELLTTELDRSTNYAGLSTDGLTKAKVLTAFELLGNADVPDDADRFALVGWRQWTELLAIDEFVNTDYIGADELPWKGATAKRWLGTMWVPHSGLPVAAGVRSCFWFHRTAIGHAIGADVTTDITWSGERQAHFVSNAMSQGACMIDPIGIVKMRCLES